MSSQLNLTVALAAQATAMFADEFYYHWKRDLPRWERIGHPVDTFTVLIVFLTFSVLPRSETTPGWVVAVMIFSCLFITKDEWVHGAQCDGGEHWLHSVLFLLHPTVFFLAWILWRESGPNALHWIGTAALVSVLIYQTVYWNLIREPSPADTPSVDNEVYHSLGERWYQADDDPVALLRAESQTKNPWVIGIIVKKYMGRPNSEIQILDVGCGGGFLSNVLARENYQVTGVDLSESSLEVARAYDTSARVEYLVGDAYRLPFKDETFDVVTCMDFLEHVERPEEVVREAARVLKKDGIFIFHTFNRSWLSGFFIIQGMEWFVKNTPKHLHILRLFVKPSELVEYCASVRLSVKRLVGISPVFNRAFWRMVRSGIVPRDFKFEITGRPRFGYLGYAEKDG